MKKLTESDVIKIFREEWAKRRERLIKEAEEIGIQTTAKVPGDGNVNTLSPGLKVKHKKSRLSYTVVSVDTETGDVLLRKPDGDVSPIEPIAGGMMAEDESSFPEDGTEDLGPGVIKISAQELEDEYILS